MSLSFGVIVLAALATQSPTSTYVGWWEGAAVRDGSVRVLRVEFAMRDSALFAVVTTPDEPGDRRERTPVTTTPAGLQLELPSFDVVTLEPNAAMDVLRWNGMHDSVPALVHLKRTLAPPPTAMPVREELVTTQGNIRLAGTLTLPPGAGPHPVVVWIHGRGGSTRSRGALIDYLARHGIGSFAYDRRGSGASTGDSESATADDLARDAIAVVRHVAAHPRVAGDRVGLHTTSAGAWIGPRVALEGPAAFLVTMVGPTESVLDQQMAVKELRLRTWEPAMSEAEIQRGLAYMRTRLEAVIAGTSQERHLKMAAELAGTPPGRAILLSPESEARDTVWLRQHGVDHTTDLRRLRVPVLAFFGEHDWVVPPERNIAALHTHLAAAGNDDVTVVVVAEADHGLNAPASPSPWRSLEWTGFRRQPAVYADTLVRWLHARFVGEGGPGMIGPGWTPE